MGGGKREDIVFSSHIAPLGAGGRTGAYGPFHAVALQLPDLPECPPAAGAGTGVRVCACGLERRLGHPPRRLQAGQARTVDRRACQAGDHGGEEDRGAFLARRGIGGLLQSSLRDLGTAYSYFFASKKGTRRGPKAGPPRFKKKASRQAVRFTKAACFSIGEDGKLRLPKIGLLPVRWSRKLPSDPSSVTIVKDAAGRFFASFVVEVESKPLPELDWDDTDTAIDLGLSSYAVLRGRKIDSPKFFRRQLCSRCGALTGPKGVEQLHVRHWVCDCGAEHDRDGNAEINLRAEGRQLLAAGRAER